MGSIRSHNEAVEAARKVFPSSPHPAQRETPELEGHPMPPLRNKFARFVKCRCSILSDFLVMKFVVPEDLSSVTNFRFINV